MMEHCWDPVDPTLSQAAVSLVSDILVYIPADGEAAAALLGAIGTRMEARCAQLRLPSWPMVAVEGLPAAMELLSR